ncbi:hypothetical protein PMAYCL1PPCAC_31433, partial [Pristionchus mayeri]
MRYFLQTPVEYRRDDGEQTDRRNSSLSSSGYKRRLSSHFDYAPILDCIPIFNVPHENLHGISGGVSADIQNGISDKASPFYIDRFKEIYG